MFNMLTFPILSSSHDIEKKTIGTHFLKRQSFANLQQSFHVSSCYVQIIILNTSFNIAIQHWKHLIKWPAVFSLSRDFPASGHLVAFQDLISSSDCQTLWPWPGASVTLSISLSLSLSLSLARNFTWLWKATVFFSVFHVLVIYQCAWLFYT